MIQIKQPLELVLLVDDDETTNYLNQRVLHKLQLARNISVTYNGEEALAFLKTPCPEGSGRPFPAPDLLFVDIKMSVMDGFEFLEQYQELEPAMKASKLFMLSSSASFYDLHRLKGFPEVVQHISKPLTEAQVLELLETHFPECLAGSRSN